MKTLPLGSIRRRTFLGQLSVGAAATHCLASEADLAALRANGIVPVLATDTVPGPAACIPVAPALAAAIRAHGFG